MHPEIFEEKCKKCKSNSTGICPGASVSTSPPCLSNEGSEWRKEGGWVPGGYLSLSFQFERKSNENEGEQEGSGDRIFQKIQKIQKIQK